MKNIQKIPHWVDIDGDALRQYIDARSAFTAWEAERKSATEVHGGMYWKRQGKHEYLIRTSVNNSQKSLGPRSAATEVICHNFTELKASGESRIAALSEALKRHQRMNRALYVGNAPRILVDILNMLARVGFSEQFIVVGDCALYAYETAAGARLKEGDSPVPGGGGLLWGPRILLSFITKSDFHDPSFLKLLQKIDSTFKVRSSYPYIALNSKGFALEIIQAKAKQKNVHSSQLPDNCIESWAVLSNRVDDLLGGPRFSTMIVASSGHMARMNTISPLAFSQLKRGVADLPDRDSITRQRNILQAEILEEFVEEFLLHLHVY
jgi:hypothetical protein